MKTNLKAARQQVHDLKEARKTQLAKLDALLSIEGRELSADEKAQDAAAKKELAETNAKLEAAEEKLRLAEQINEAERGSSGIEVREAILDKPWDNDGEFYQAVAGASKPGAVIDPRLLAGPTGGSTGVPSDGGFFVGKDRSLKLLQAMETEAVLLPECDRIEISENSDGWEGPYIDETSRANGSRFGGVQVFRAAEADTVTAKKPKYALMDLRLEDMIGLTYMTERQLRDAAVTKQVVERAFASEFAFKTDDEIFRGSGVGQMQGWLNAPCKIEVAKETGQAADTVLYENVLKMWGRLPARLRTQSAWYVNQDVETIALPQMAQIIGAGGVPVYLPANGISGQGFGTLFGRPVKPLEYCSALGDVGDIVLAAPKEYLVIEKGGMQADESIHVRFLYNERAFRWVIRNNGASKWKSALTPFKGSSTISPVITLAAR
jgi:HK97 family phage major capsid protein